MTSLSLRTDKELLNELDLLAKLNNTDRATEARKILKEGILNAKLELALKFYRQGDSIGYSAEKAQVSLWNLIDYIAKTGQTQVADYQELMQEYQEQLK